MNRTRFFVGYKVLFGLLSLFAVATEIIVTVGRGTFNPGNFFSYFTIESNMFAAAILLVSAYCTARGKRSQLLSFLRGAATLYMVITGLVFAILLSGIKGVHFTAVPRDNVILHYIMPVVVLLDWLIDVVPARLAFRCGLRWIIYPLIYVGYTLLRGPRVGWYPYPFLNPSHHGYGAVFITSAVIAVIAVVIVYVLTQVGGSQPTSKLRREAARA
jgi:hypothetical protein